MMAEDFTEYRLSINDTDQQTNVAINNNVVYVHHV